MGMMGSRYSFWPCTRLPPWKRAARRWRFQTGEDKSQQSFCELFCVRREFAGRRRIWNEETLAGHFACLPENNSCFDTNGEGNKQGDRLLQARTDLRRGEKQTKEPE